ncbi:MAG: S8 family serine peptidase [Candidatus Sericytochromatia bacterium]
MMNKNLKKALSLSVISLSVFTYSCNRKSDLLANPPEAKIEKASVETTDKEFLVKRRGLSHLQGDAAFESKYGAKIVKTIKPLLIDVITVEDKANIDEMSKDSSIEYVEPNYIRTMKIKTSDTSTSGVSSSSVQTASIMKANSIYKGKSFTSIAVVSTGVDLNHPDLKNKLVTGYSTFNENDSAQDINGAGTHQAGLIVASNASAGVYGVAPSCKVMPIKAMNEDGQAKDSNLIDGIVWAIDHGASVVTFTADGVKPSKAFDDAIKYAYTKKVPLIVGSGDFENNEKSYPAASNGVIAVSALGDGAKATSNTGDWVSVSAPGVAIMSTSSTKNSKIPSNYAALSGSSVAAAYVAGQMALIKTKYPTLDMLGLRKHLELTTDDLGQPGPDNETGFGKINVVKSLSVEPPKKK